MTANDWLKRREEEQTAMTYALCSTCWRPIRYDWDDSVYGADSTVCLCEPRQSVTGDEVLKAHGLDECGLVQGRYKKSGWQRRD